MSNKKSKQEQVQEFMDWEKTRDDKICNAVNPLGVQNGKYVFYPSNTKHLTKIDAKNMGNEFTLYSIVGIDLLNLYFEKINKEGKIIGIDFKEAAKFLMNKCHILGRFEESQFKGVGIWKDRNNFIVNTGTELYINNELISHDKLRKNSDNIFDKPGIEYIKVGKNFTNDELQTVWEIINGFAWSKEHEKYLLLGVLVQAVIGSALDWRSHVWIIGAQGSGKSWLQFKFIRPLLGKFCIGAVAGTTSAGLTQKLGCNAFAISYDEAETRTNKDFQIMNDILGLARSSSSQDSCFIKGSATGQAVEYRCQSTFIMSSISPFLKQESDIARFAILELLKPKGEQEANKIKFENLVTKNCLKIDSEFSEKWISFCISLVPKIQYIRKEIDIKLSQKNIDSRARDQYGQLISCAAAALNQEIDLSIFEDTLEITKENDAEAEPIRVFNEFMSHEIGVPSNYGTEKTTILELLRTVDHLQKIEKKDLESLESDAQRYDLKKLERFLGSYGLKVVDDFLYIANTSKKIEAILNKTNFCDLFKIIKGFEVGKNATTFGSRIYKSRYIRIETQKILSDDVELEKVDEFVLNLCGF